MARLAVLIGIVAVVFTIYAFIDSIVTPRYRVRAIPKVAWIVVVFLLPVVGGILWLVLGKEGKRSAAVRAQRAPDDDPAFLRSLGGSGAGRVDDVGSDQERDARIRDLEARLAELDDDHDDPKK